MQRLPDATTLRTHGRARARDQALLLALSDEREAWHAHSLAMWQDGYRTGLAQAEAAYHTGLADALLAIKRLNKGFVGDLKAHLAMWGGRPRSRFADPQPGDFPGRAAS